MLRKGGLRKDSQQMVINDPSLGIDIDTLLRVESIGNTRPTGGEWSDPSSQLSSDWEQWRECYILFPFFSSLIPPRDWACASLIYQSIIRIIFIIILRGERTQCTISCRISDPGFWTKRLFCRDCREEYSTVSCL